MSLILIGKEEEEEKSGKGQKHDVDVRRKIQADK